MQDKADKDSAPEICVQILYEGGNPTCDLQCPSAWWNGWTRVKGVTQNLIPFPDSDLQPMICNQKLDKEIHRIFLDREQRTAGRTADLQGQPEVITCWRKKLLKLNNSSIRASTYKITVQGRKDRGRIQMNYEGQIFTE